AKRRATSSPSPRDAPVMSPVCRGCGILVMTALSFVAALPPTRSDEPAVVGFPQALHDPKPRQELLAVPIAHGQPPRQSLRRVWISGGAPASGNGTAGWLAVRTARDLSVGTGSGEVG